MLLINIASFFIYCSMENLKLRRVRERFLNCPVCLDEYDDPRLLPCLHSICYECLQQLKNASSMRLIQCPQCRAPISTSQEFPANFLINSLKEEITTSFEQKVCDSCTKDSRLAKYNCSKCNMDLCSWCATKHNLTLHMDSVENILVPIQVNYPDPKEPPEAECQLHSGEYLQVFCVTCTKDICLQCYYKSHYRHKTKPLKEMLSTFKELTEKEFEYLEGIKDQIDLQLSKLDLVKNQITTSRDEVLSRIYDSRDQFLYEVQASVNEQVKKVNLWQSQLMHELDRHYSKLQNCYKSIERGSKVFEQIKDEETNFPTMHEFSKFFSRIEAEQESLHRRSFKVKKIKFHQTWRFKFQPFFGAFFGYPYYETEKVEIFPRIEKRKKKVGLVKIFLRLVIFFSVLSGVYQNFYENTFCNFWLIFSLQLYLLLSFVLCW